MQSFKEDYACYLLNELLHTKAAKEQRKEVHVKENSLIIDNGGLLHSFFISALVSSLSKKLTHLLFSYRLNVT